MPNVKPVRRYKNQPVPEGLHLFEFTTDTDWLERTRPMAAFLALERAGWELDVVKPKRFGQSTAYTMLPSGYVIVSASKPFASAREAAAELKRVTGLDLADGQYYNIDDPQEENVYFHALTMLDEYGETVVMIEGESLEDMATKPQTACSKETMAYIESREKKHFDSAEYKKKKAAFVPPKSTAREFEDDRPPIRTCR